MIFSRHQLLVIWWGIITIFFCLLTRVLLTRSQPTIFVGLMNANEAKPFWWFFGSFLLFDIKPRSIARSLHDSYEPATKTSYRHPLPNRYAHIMPLGDGKIGMLGANMLGWTAMDAHTIRAITYQAYNRNPDRVILVNSNLFASLLPAWDQIVHRRQFLNATVDLRRGIITGNKKEDTFIEIRNYLTLPQRWATLLTTAITSLRTSQWNGLLHIDPPVTRSRLLPWLEKKQRHRRYQPSSLYRGWYNLSFNKIDERTSTLTTIYRNDQWSHSTSWRTLPIDWSGSFRLIQTMTVNIPDNYHKRITHWAQEEWIILTPREKTILSLTPQIHRRHVFFLPPQAILGEVDWLENKKIVPTDTFLMVIGDIRGIPPMTQSISIPFVLE